MRVRFPRPIRHHPRMPAQSFFSRLGTAFQIWRYSLGDKRTPGRAKVLPIVSLLYVLFPIDVIPDLLPLIGQTDDAVVLIVLLLMAWNAIPKDVKRDARSNVIDVTPKE
jgi:uncharacterized membrane protein YkvA (DUF1232 family)